MSGPGPSSTAISAAMMRAAHLVLDAEPPILRDPHAQSLSGLPDGVALEQVMARIENEFAPYGDALLAADIVRDLRATIVLRNRYAEDQLQTLIARGVRQYVMLGAGLDSYAHRAVALPADMQLFEVDLPAMQRWKRERLRTLGLAAPATLHYVEADFEAETPLQALARSSFDHERPALFSWLGVTGYLTQDAVYETLADLAKAAAGSAVVFSYGLADAHVDARGQRIAAVLKQHLAARQEPAANHGFDPRDLAQRLRAMGYGQLEELDAAAAQARYFDGRNDGLRAPSMIRLLLAGTGAAR